MAVPKRKTTPSKRGLRRGGNKAFSVELPNVITDKTTGEYKLSHQISLDGYYKGKKVIKDKVKKTSETEE